MIKVCLFCFLLYGLIIKLRFYVAHRDFIKSCTIECNEFQFLIIRFLLITDYRLNICHRGELRTRDYIKLSSPIQYVFNRIWKHDELLNNHRVVVSREGMRLISQITKPAKKREMFRTFKKMPWISKKKECIK